MIWPSKSCLSKSRVSRDRIRPSFQVRDAMADNASDTPVQTVLAVLIFIVAAAEVYPPTLQLDFPVLMADRDPLSWDPYLPPVRKPPDPSPPSPILPAKSFRLRRRNPAAAALVFDLDLIRFWSNPKTSSSKFFNLAFCPLSLQVVNFAPQLPIRSEILWIMFYGFLVIVLSGCVVWFVVLEIGDGMIRGRHKIQRWFWVPGWQEGQVLSSGSF